MKRAGKHPGPVSRGGFTLIELILVIVILGIVATVVVPMVTGGSAIKPQAAARVVKSALERAQSEALRSGDDVSVSFTAGSAVFTVTAHRMSGDETLESVDLYRESGVGGITVEDVGLDGSGIVFQADGTVLNGSWGQLSGSSYVTVGNGTDSCRVEIDPITGTVAIP